VRCHFTHLFGLPRGSRSLGRVGHGFIDGGSVSSAEDLAGGRRLTDDLRFPSPRYRAEKAGAAPSAEQERQGSGELGRATHELQLALLDVWIDSTEEEQRIAAILKRATAEIQGLVE